MKTHAGKLSPLVLVVIASVLLLVRQPSYAGNITPTHTIDITENSSTSLTLLYDGMDITTSAVANNATDQWTLTFDPTIAFTSFVFGWTEPGDPTKVNLIQSATLGIQNSIDAPNAVVGANMLTIVSDFASGVSSFPDGTTVPEPGFISGNLVTFNITFHDLGDAAVPGVPESASTLGLLFLSLTALLGIRRARSARLA